MNQQDLSGKIVFKVRLDKEIKKIVIHNDDINYNELLLMMQRIFSDKIRPNDEFTIKYTDEENDLITLSNDSDVLLAIQTSKILKLTIFLLGKDKEEPVEELKPADVVRELQSIRASIDRFLDKFDRILKLDKNAAASGRFEEAAKTPTEVAKPVNGLGGLPLIKSDAHREFDPLNRRSEPDGVHHKNSRAGSPDSISSATDLKQRYEQPQQLQQPPNGAGIQAANVPLNQPPQVQQAPVVMPGQQLHQQAPHTQGFAPQQQQPLQRPPQQAFQSQVGTNPQIQAVVGQTAPSQLYQHQPIAPQQPQQQQQYNGPAHTGPVDLQSQAHAQGFSGQQAQLSYGQYMPPTQALTQQQQPQLQQAGGSFHALSQQSQSNIGSPQQVGYGQQSLTGGAGLPPSLAGGANPFSKPPGTSLTRPPSASPYAQLQGYK